MKRNDPVEIIIHKPLYGNFCYIRDKFIDQAIRENKRLKIVLPQGSGYADPAEWRKTGKKMEKEFRIPGRPMILWGNYVTLEETTALISEK